MRDSPAIRRFAPDEWRRYRDLRLRALSESPDAFGSTVEAEGARADTEWASRLAAAATADLPLVAEVAGVAAGLAWGRIREDAPEVAQLYQVWVAPEHRGRGVGRRLLAEVVDWARAAGARYLDLEVARGETPAMRLYVRAGFRPAGDARPLRPGSPIAVQPMRLVLGNAAAPSA